MSAVSSTPEPNLSAAAAATNAAALAAGAETVLIVDDDPAVRRGVSRLVRAAGFHVRTFASPADFLLEDLPAGPACLLLDMCMDEMSGLQVQSALRARVRQLPVVFVSGQSTITSAATGFKAGAEDFLEKPVPPKVLLDAIRRALHHDAGRRADLADLHALRCRYEDLTPREREVMALVVSGLLNKQVAGELGISEKTVKVHRARVMEKMNVVSLALLVLIAQRLGIVTAGAAHREHAATTGDPAWLATVS
jgi:FixJ family two-component response regulator